MSSSQLKVTQESVTQLGMSQGLLAPGPGASLLPKVHPVPPSCLRAGLSVDGTHTILSFTCAGPRVCPAQGPLPPRTGAST